MIVALALCLAGGLGASARLVIDGLVTSRLSRGRSARRREFPVGTFAINIIGSFALGLVVGLGREGVLPVAAVSILGTGFLGGFTTFSTASMETIRLLSRGRWWAAVGCGAGMLAAALLAAAAGLVLVDH